jgi:hypothetical protein
MKRVINSIFAYFGQKPPFQVANFNRAKSHYSGLISIEKQAIDFVQDALKVINDRVRIELTRNGYDPNDALSGKLHVTSTATTSKTDARFKSNVYAVNGYVILKVSWKPNGFTLETNTADMCRGNKQALRAGLQQGDGNTKAIADSEKKEVEVEALANKKINDRKAMEIAK